MIEDVKKILDEYVLNKPTIKRESTFGYTTHIHPKDTKDIAQQLCNLEPKGGLPTYDGFVRQYGKRPADIAFNMAVRLTAKEKDGKRGEENSANVTEAYFKGRQDGLMMKEAECRERIEGIKRELEGLFEPTVPMSIDYKKWRAFWKKKGVK